LLIDDGNAVLEPHASYVREQLEDMPEFTKWSWTSQASRL